MSTVIPAFYYYFFWLVEPVLTIAGGASAVFDTAHFAADMLPPSVEVSSRMLGTTVRGRMLVGGLGNCFFLLALISFSIFPMIRSLPFHLQTKVALHLLVPLAIADLTHLAVILLPLPMSVLQDPSKWTITMMGHVWITLGLFIVRSAFFLGIGRNTNVNMLNTAKTK